MLRELLARADPLTAKYIVKVLGGDLRIGLREGLVEAAIAKAFDRPLDDVKWAGMLAGDIGRLAALARDDRLATADARAVPSAQVHARLARRGRRRDRHPARSRGLGRGQVRRHPGTAPQGRFRGPVYSRDLHDVSSGYPEIVAAAAASAVGRHPRWRDPRLARRPCLPFIALQARLGRKAPSAAIRAEIQVIYVAFDVLAVGPGDGARSRAAPALFRSPCRGLQSAEGPSPRRTRRRRGDRGLRSTRRNLLRSAGYPEDKVSVVPLGVEPEFHPVDLAPARARVAARYQLHGPYILFVGTLEPRKNVSSLLAAYRALIQGPLAHRADGPPAAGHHQRAGLVVRAPLPLGPRTRPRRAGAVPRARPG